MSKTNEVKNAIPRSSVGHLIIGTINDTTSGQMNTHGINPERSEFICFS